MTSKVKAMMDQIDAMLARCDNDSADLWAILTALRGPDDTNQQYRKTKTTVMVRRMVLPQLAKRSDDQGILMDWPEISPFYPSMSTWGEPVRLERYYKRENHFLQHYGAAADAIEREDPAKDGE